LLFNYPLNQVYSLNSMMSPCTQMSRSK